MLEEKSEKFRFFFLHHTPVQLNLLTNLTRLEMKIQNLHFAFLLQLSDVMKGTVKISRYRDDYEFDRIQIFSLHNNGEAVRWEML